MDDPYRFLYVGTYNSSIAWKEDPVYGPLLEHNMGAHLYRSPDGWYYSPITTNGFADPADPFGGKFDYGIRTMATTPHGAFVGTTNDHYGLMIFRAKSRGSNAPDALTRLEIEPKIGGAALLSWEPSSSKGVKYQIWRAEIISVLIRDDVNIEAWNNETGNKIPDTYVGPYEKIGTTDKLNFTDASVNPTKRYMYYVVIQTKDLVSDPSDLVTFPLLTPSMTFAGLLANVNRMDQRGRYRDPIVRMTRVRKMVTDAQTLAAKCKVADAIKTLSVQKASNDVLEPENVDLQILMSKLIRRLTLYTQMPQDVSMPELCVQP
jgi:hypothetical protein